MGSEPSSESNSASKDGRLNQINFLKENENTLIKRVWIVKKSINLNDRNVKPNLNIFSPIIIKNKVELVKPNQNVFKIKNNCNAHFKHWAIILELSNDSYVNIQFGRNGFSLNEFNKTDIDGESVFNAILDTWGQEDAPFSFCYLGNFNDKYDKLKNSLIEMKKKETEKYEKTKMTYYNLCFKNCQNFVCEIEKILFGKIQGVHSFDYYLDQFFGTFFKKIKLEKLKSKYEKEINEKNKELFKLNVKNIKDFREKMISNPSDSIFAKMLGKNYYDKDISYYKKLIEEWYSLKYDNYLY